MASLIDAAPRIAPGPDRIEAQAPGSTMQRPRERDPAIRRKAAEAIAEECADWAGDRRPADTWVEPILACHDWDNGYAFARDLERRAHVDPDAALVEILDGGGSHLRTVRDRAVRDWVRIVGFTPAHAVGDLVTCRHGTGPIHSINVDLAQYVVDVERRGNGGFVVDAETVTTG